MNTETEHGDG